MTGILGLPNTRKKRQPIWADRWPFRRGTLVMVGQLNEDQVSGAAPEQQGLCLLFERLIPGV